MTLTLALRDGSNVLEIGISGVLTAADLGSIAAQVGRMLRPLVELRLLVTLREFAGWDAAAGWDESGAATKHLAHVERVAVVGLSKWESGMGKLTRPFTRAECRYFSNLQLQNARAWLCEPKQE